MIFNNKSKCTLHQKVVVCEECHKKYIANNIERDEVYKYKIDGDVLSPSTSQPRCDFLVENATKGNAYLIELKGTDITHAVEQIEATICLFSAQLGDYTILPRIVYRRNTHGIRSSKVNAFKRKYPKTKIQTNVIEENI